MSIDPTLKPKGRIGIRPDSNSPFVGLWRYEATPGTTMAKLEAAYLAGLDAVDRAYARRKEIEATKKFAPAGVRDELGRFAKDELAAPLRRHWHTVQRAKAELAQRRAKIRLKEPDPSDVIGEMRRAEIRAWLRSLPNDEERVRVVSRGDKQIQDAVLHAPEAMSGVPRSTRQFLMDRRLREEFGAEIDQVIEMEQAIERAERSVDLSRVEVRELISSDVFDHIVKPVEDEIDRVEMPKTQAAASGQPAEDTRSFDERLQALMRGEKVPMPEWKVGAA